MATKQDFITKVLFVMNEADASSMNDILLGADKVEVVKYVENTFVDAWKYAVNVAPKIYFEKKSFLSSQIVKDLTDGIGYVVLPDDYYELYSFKMQGWRKEVHQVFIDEGQVQSLQANEYTRGSVIRPVCTLSGIAIGSTIKQVLNYYSLPKGLADHLIEQAIYIPVIKPLNETADDEVLNIGEKIFEPLAYFSARMVYTIFEKYDISTALEQKGKELIPLIV